MTRNGTLPISDDGYFIIKCLDLMEENLQMGKKENWTTHNFEQISDKIYEATQVAISVKTLKRLFGTIKYKELYSPQPQTKKALAQYLGFEGWDDFKKSIAIDYDKPGEALPDGITDFRPDMHPKPSYKRFFKALFIIIILYVAAIILYRQKGPAKLAPVMFNVKYAAGPIPYTAVFQYDISKLSSDSISIDFGDENTVLLDKSKKLITHTYYIPDLYKVKMKAGNAILKQVNVHALSTGWETFVQNENEKQRKIIVKRNYAGMLAAYPTDIVATDTNQYYKVKFRNVRKFDADGDNFNFITHVKTDITHGVDCHRITLRIVCEKGDILFGIKQLGCFKGIGLRFSDFYINGDFEDLSNLQSRLDSWQELRLLVKNKTVTFFNNNTILYQKKYSKPLGKIMGLNYTFNNNGAINDVKVYDKNNRLVFNDEFTD